MRDLPIFPEQASNFAFESDALYWTLTLLTAVFTILVFAMVAVLAVKYRRGARVDRSNPVHHSSILEMSWSIGPLILGLAVFVWSAKLFAAMYGQAPKDSLEIYVIGKQWMWHLQHPNGVRENNELHLPVGRPVKLTMISQDVIHSFFIPAFRIKRDVIPGIYTTVWFTPTKAGKYHIFCAEYCGTQHSEMTGSVYVMEPADFQQWLASGGQRTQDTQPLPPTMAAKGKAIYEQQGCGNCHDSDGMNRGPTLAGLYGSQVKTRDGRMVKADESFLRRAIMEPSDEIAEAYQQIMPSYKDQITEEQLLQVIEYIKSLTGRSPAGAARPATGVLGSGAAGVKAAAESPAVPSSAASGGAGEATSGTRP